MDGFTKEELQEACNTIEPTISQLEQMESKFKTGTSQHTLLIRRVKAFNIAIMLIKQELQEREITDSYTKEELKEALQEIQSTISKSEKIPPKLKERSARHATLLRQIKAYSIAKVLIDKELDCGVEGGNVLSAEQLLRNPDIQPTDEVLADALGDSFSAWQSLVEKLSDFKIAVEWRYYKDGKAWLGKCVSGKKTVLWTSAWDGYFRTSLFFTEKTRAGIQDLPIDESIKTIIANEPLKGKLIPLLIDVCEEKQLPDVITLIDYKRRIK